MENVQNSCMLHELLCKRLIGASLSEPHTSESSGTSVAFTKIYVEIRIAWRVHKSLRLKSDYKPDNLQMLPVHILITRRITRVVY